MKKFFTLCLILTLAFGVSLAKAPKQSSTTQPISRDQIADFGEPAPVLTGMPLSCAPLNRDDPIGDLFELGTTWYDIQHNSTCGHQIQVEEGGWIHTVWMNGLNNQAVDRHIFYQLIDANDSLYFSGGVQVDQVQRSGYTDLTLNSEGRAFPCYHRNQDGIYWFTTTSWDFFPHFGAFSTMEAPHVYAPMELAVGWPKITCDRNDILHIVSTENPLSGVAGDPQRQYYIGAEYDPLSYTFTYNDDLELIEWCTTISSQVAASPVSDRVAIAYLRPWATDPTDTTQHDNNLILVTSEDGIEWDWADTINITNWIEPDDGLLPDTLTANKDTLRCYAEIDLIFDYNDNLHIFFTTEGYYHYEGTVTWGNGYIWHWDEHYQVFSMVSNGWFENGFYNPGAWNTYTTRPQAGIDAETGDIYCMYQRYFQPIAESALGFPYQVGDTTDFSQGGWPNGEIWMTKSVDGGYYWSEGINITNTASPNMPAGQCMSELTPSMAPKVTDGHCHVFYILDHDAGTPVQSEGTWTLNDAVYQRVPIGDIPEGPVLPPYPMHCDSTGMPDPDFVSRPGTSGTPDRFVLHSAYPNPFNPAANIYFELREANYVKLTVYDISGREVARLAEGYYTAGTHQAVFEGANLASGIYFANLTAGDFQQTQKLVLLK